MNNDQAVTSLNDVAYTYRCEADTPTNREECITELKAVGEMGDSFTTSEVDRAILNINNGGDYHSILDTLVTWSEDCLDEIMGGC